MWDFKKRVVYDCMVLELRFVYILVPYFPMTLHIFWRWTRGLPCPYLPSDSCLPLSQVRKVVGRTSSQILYKHGCKAFLDITFQEQLIYWSDGVIFYIACRFYADHRRMQRRFSPKPLISPSYHNDWLQLSIPRMWFSRTDGFLHPIASMLVSIVSIPDFPLRSELKRSCAFRSASKQPCHRVIILAIGGGTIAICAYFLRLIGFFSCGTCIIVIFIPGAWHLSDPSMSSHVEEEFPASCGTYWGRSLDISGIKPEVSLKLLVSLTTSFSLAFIKHI